MQKKLFRIINIVCWTSFVHIILVSTHVKGTLGSTYFEGPACDILPQMKDTLKLRYQTVSSWKWIICIATRFEKELVWSYIFTSVPLPPRTPHPPLSIPLFHLGLPVTLLASHRLFRHHTTATQNTNNDYSATHDI